MTTWTQDDGECLVFTRKEGLLSKVAHDLQLRVTRWTVTWRGEPGAIEGIEAQLDASSLRVVGAMRDGQLAPGVLSDSDKQKIERNIVQDVLRARVHPTITFAADNVTASGAGWSLSGRLQLCGKSRQVSLFARKDGEIATADVPIHQPDFGIKPYTAMLGTLKVHPDVTVRVTLPLPATAE